MAITTGDISVLDHTNTQSYEEDTKAELSASDEKSSAKEFSESHVKEADAEAVDLHALSSDVEAVWDYAQAMTVEEVTEILTTAWAEHYDDPNFPNTVKDQIQIFLNQDQYAVENYDRLLEDMKIEAALIRYSSPYPEVRAVVDMGDNASQPVNTFRVWVLGTIWCGLGAFINQFFSIRTPSISLSVNEIQLLTYPLGVAMAAWLPTKKWKIFGREFTLNPGPFSEKEHMLLTIMANVGTGTPYSANIIIIQALPMFYNQSWARDFGYQLTTTIAIMFLGYGYAGMARRFLVYPEHMIWWTTLPNIALNKSFHSSSNPVANGWKISRRSMFGVCFAIMFIYFWIPDALFTALSYFNWTTWISPTNVTLAAVTGLISGVGLNPLPTFDWNFFGGTNYMIYPMFNTLNSVAGMAMSIPVILAFWYRNVYDTGYFPLNSNRVFDRFTTHYNVTTVLDSSGDLDVDAYKVYSKPYMAASNLVIYTGFFATYAATVTHTILFHRKEIAAGLRTAWRSIRSGKRANESFQDSHNKEMSKYNEVPEWWYLIVTLIAIAFGVGGLAGYPTNANVSSIFFGSALCIVLIIPVGIIYGITGTEITLNVFAEFIGGLAYSGNAISMNYFKSFGVMILSNAMSFTNDLKLGHYMKIPPRLTFTVQIYGTLIASFVTSGILNFQMNIDGVCTADQPNKFICNGENTFFTASVFWGTLGPKRVFGTNPGIYSLLLLGFAVGGILPIPFYFLTKKYPRSWVSKIHIPVFLSGTLGWNPYTTFATYYPGAIVGYISLVYIKGRYLAWWSKYNYIVAVAFGSAIPLAGIIIFGALEEHPVNIDWWGNDVTYAGCDASGCPRLELPDVGYIGEASGWF